MTTPEVEVTQELIDTLVGLGGYTHPLFVPAAGSPAPMPGQGVLLLVGGLVERSRMLDEAIALLELREVRFSKMLRAPTTLRVELTPGEARETGSGKVIRHYRWSAIDGSGDQVLEATAVMLMRAPMP
ncbi:hypothetical protein [Streptosporangium amethystogenes]|uniref:hypothetical protein n=1 Tax=Streptosporangium amethystogenes TaxID=2002 RepID=UPI0012FAB065|nr:hypothetical protein [Streptosporangium amethystogenes]